jgi:hypothetical protein
MDHDPIKMREKLLQSLGGPMTRSLDDIGITDEYLARKLKEELDAKITKQFQYEGEVIEAPDVKAWEIRQRARIDAHKLRGDYPAERKHVQIEGGLPQLELTEDEKIALEAMKEQIKRKKGLVKGD